MSVETPESELRIRASDLLMGRSAQWLDGEIDRLNGITHEQVQRALATWLQPQNMRITVVCTATDLMDGFRRLPQVEEVQVVDYMEP